MPWQLRSSPSPTRGFLLEKRCPDNWRWPIQRQARRRRRRQRGRRRGGRRSGEREGRMLRGKEGGGRLRRGGTRRGRRRRRRGGAGELSSSLSAPPISTNRSLLEIARNQNTITMKTFPSRHHLFLPRCQDSTSETSTKLPCCLQRWSKPGNLVDMREWLAFIVT